MCKYTQCFCTVFLQQNKKKTKLIYLLHPRTNNLKEKVTLKNKFVIPINFFCGDLKFLSMIQSHRFQGGSLVSFTHKTSKLISTHLNNLAMWWVRSESFYLGTMNLRSTSYLMCTLFSIKNSCYKVIFLLIQRMQQSFLTTAQRDQLTLCK